MLTPIQCRMARAALLLGVRDLAAKAGLSAMTVTRFENGHSPGSPETQVALRSHTSSPASSSSQRTAEALA